MQRYCQYNQNVGVIGAFEYHDANISSDTGIADVGILVSSLGFLSYFLKYGTILAKSIKMNIINSQPINEKVV